MVGAARGSRPPRLALALLVAGTLATTAPPAHGDGLADLAMLKDFRAGRISSYDRSGGNADGGSDRPIRPGETRTLAEIGGAGAITHLWFTVASKDERHLKNLALRMYWDGEKEPSVEAPLGDLFGLCHARYYAFSSAPIQIGSERGLSCFWRMPFARGARVTITNDGPLPVEAFYYYIDYEQRRRVPGDEGRFHAQYRQAYPCAPGQAYTLLEATGRGHYVGCVLSVHNRAPGWWGEGDDMFTVDGEPEPSLHGTGSEDYFGGGWAYGESAVQTFFGPFLGCPFNDGGHAQNALWTVYRFHVQDPVPFRRSLRAAFEHGHANNRADDFASVAFWYQTEPHAPFPPLPKAAERMPSPATVFVEPYVFEAEALAAAFGSPDVAAEPTVAHGNAWSSGSHLAIGAAGPGVYQATVPVSRSEAGTYAVEWWVTTGPDYGRCELWFNGAKVCAWDGYRADGLARVKVPGPGVLTVKPEGNVLELRVVGKSAGSAGYRAGLDCYRVTPR